MTYLPEQPQGIYTPAPVGTRRSGLALGVGIACLVFSAWLVLGAISQIAFVLQRADDAIVPILLPALVPNVINIMLMVTAGLLLVRRR